MDKSAYLDEIRLEVGLVSDKVCSKQDFYFGIMKVMGKYLKQKNSIGLYRAREGYFELVTSVGERKYEPKEKFGEGNISLCAIKGHIYTLNLCETIHIFNPFYHGHHLLGVFVFEVYKSVYHFTEEDLIFLREISRHIELQHGNFSN